VFTRRRNPFAVPAVQSLILDLTLCGFIWKFMQPRIQKNFTAVIIVRILSRINMIWENTWKLTKKKPYSCFQCSKSFEYADQLKAHLICHTEEKGALRCPNCPMIFSKSSHLRSHLSTHSGVHMEIHTAEKPKKTYSCAYCKNFFTNKRAYFKHIKTHTEVNPYGCSQWPKSFEHADQLKVHFICHTGEEGAFRCPNCSKYIF